MHTRKTLHCEFKAACVGPSELTTKLVQSFKDLLTPKRQPSTAENSPYIPRRSTTAGLPPVTASPCSARLPRNMRRWRLPTVGSPGPPIKFSEPQSSTDNTGHNGEFNPGIRSANSSVNSHEQLTNQLQNLRDHWFYVAGGLAVGNLHQRLLTATLSAQLHGRIPQKCTGFPHSPDSGQLPPPAACAVSRSPSVQWLNDHERTPSEEPHTMSPNPRTTNVSQLIVSLTTCNTCPHCRKFVHDEEIMAAWTADEEQYDIRCPFCSCAFVPQLTVRVLGELRRSDLSPSPPCSPRSPPSRGGSTPPSRIIMPPEGHGYKLSFYPIFPTSFEQFTDGPHSCIVVMHPGLTRQGRSTVNSDDYVERPQHFYLSPFALRKSLETVLQREGDECFRYNPMKHSFLCRYERLAWNLIWYIHRLGLPTHLLDGFASWLMERQLERQRNATADTMRGEIPGKVLDGLLHVQLSPDLPVRVSLRWNAYHNNRGTVNKPLYKLWSRHMAEYRNRGIRPSDLFVDNRRSALKERILAISSCPVYLVMAYIVSDIVSNKVFSALDLLVRLRTSVFTKMPVSTVIQLREQQQHAADEGPSGDTPDTASNSSHSCSDVSPLPLENSTHSPCTESRCCVCALEDSLYRELLFLILTALTAQGINVAHFDEEYRDAYMRHLSNQCPSLFDSDRAPNHVAAACRQMLRPLSLIP
ncbi:unnamed protein product [Dicrocoelium dendriticum]|nr:unnamed protein product [Dicrocoelium dendriticum]